MTSENRQESSYDLATYDVKLSRPKHPYSCGMSGVYDRRMFEISERGILIPGSPLMAQDQWVGLRFQRRHEDCTLTSNLFNPAHAESQTSHSTTSTT